MKAIALELQQRVSSGSRALLVYPYNAGLKFIYLKIFSAIARGRLRRWLYLLANAKEVIKHYGGIQNTK